MIKIKLNIEARNPNNAYGFCIKNKRVIKFLKGEYKRYKQEWINEAKRIMGNNEPLKCDIRIVSTWTFGTKRKKDVQNCGKLEFDAFNGVIYEDDSQIIEDIRKKYYKKGEPSVEIIIIPLNTSNGFAE